MAELKFTEDDGPIQLRLEDHDAIVEGKGLIRYVRRGMLRYVMLQRLHRSTLLRFLDTITKVATIISLVGMVVLWIWKWQAGAAAPAFVSIASNVFLFKPNPKQIRCELRISRPDVHSMIS